MPVWKCDLIFEASGRGWRETYYRQFPGSTFGSTIDTVTTLATKRAALMGAPCVIKAFEIQDPLTAGKQGQTFYLNPPKTANQEAGADGASSPGSSINVRWIVNVGNLTRMTSMRGVWDSAITNFNQLNSPGYALWWANFLTYRTYVLQQGYGWLNVPRAAEAAGVVYDYDLDPLRPHFVFPSAFFAAPQVNTDVLVRFSKFNNSDSPLNRELICTVNSTTACTAALPIAAGPMLNPGRAIRYGTPIFNAADNVTVDRVGRRNPGAPLLYTPGRRSNRARS